MGAAIEAMQRPNQVVRVGGNSGAAFRYIKWGDYTWLIVKLQSGRVLFYFEPKLDEYNNLISYNKKCSPLLVHGGD